MLIGQYTSRLSKKRRVAIPAKFRAELGEKVILTRWYENCLVLVSFDQWNLLVNKLIGEAKGITEPMRDTDRFLLGLAYEFDLDDQGRGIIPENLAKYAGIEENIVFLGLGNRVEIWEESEWLKREKYVTESASKLIDKLVNKEK